MSGQPGYQRGDRIALACTADPHTRLQPGDEGTVTSYDPRHGQLNVRWDSGSTLAMLLADGDRVRLITPAPEHPGPEGDGRKPRTTRRRRPQHRETTSVRSPPMDIQLYGSYTTRRYRAATSGEIERMLSAPRLDHRTCPPGRGGDVFIAPADDDEEFWSAWHARHPQPPAPAAASITAEAASLGRDAGKAAASWMFDGNTPEDAYRAVLRGIDDGDPAILDAHPVPGLSAGGGYREADLARDLGLDGGDQLPPGAATAYLAAADQTFWDETERLAREHLAGTRLAVTGTEPGR